MAWPNIRQIREVPYSCFKFTLKQILGKVQQFFP